MPRKTTILIIVLAVVTVSLIFLAVREESRRPATEQGEQTVTQTPEPTEEEVNETAVLSFSPAFLDLSESFVTTSSVDIFVDTGGSPITSVQIELQYDPAVLSNVSIDSSEGTIFGENPNVLLTSVNPETGRVTHILGINLSDEQVSGVGKVATLNFQALSGTEPQTQIEFLDRSIVATLGTTESILKETVPLTISLPASGGFIPPQQTIPPTDQSSQPTEEQTPTQ